MPIPSRGTGAGGGGGGASALTDLTDTPDAIFPADAGKAVIVKRDSTGFEFDDLANDGYYKLGPTPNRFESETERNTQAHDRANEAWLNEYVNDATSVIRLVDTTANTVTIQAEPTVTNTDNTVFGATAPLDVEDVRAVYGLQDSADGKYYITFDNNGDATKLKNLIEGKNQADRIILKDTADNQEVELVSAEIIRQRSQQTVFAKTVTHTTSTGPVTTTIAAQSVVTAISLFDEQDPDDSTRNIFKVRLTMGTGTTGRSNAEGFVTVVDAIIKNLVPSDDLRPPRIKFSQGSGGNEISHDLQLSAIISENSTVAGTTTYFAVLTIGGIHTSTAGAPASGTTINTGWDVTANFHNNDWRVIFTVEGTEQSPFATVPGPSQWDIVDRDISVAWKNISGAGVGNTVFTDDTLTGDGATAATALSVVRQPPAQGDPMQGPEIETFRLAASLQGLNPVGNGRWSRISDNEIRIVERNAGMVAKFRAATHVWFDGRRYPIAFADRTRANTYEIVLTGVVFPTSGNLAFYEDAEAISDKNLEGLGGDSNVQADWSETDSTDDAFIQNKPTIPTAFSDLTGQVADSQIPASIARDSEITDAIDDLKGSGLPAGRDTLKELSDAIDGISGGDSGIVRVAASTSYDAAETAALNGKIIIAQSIINNIVLTFTAPTTVTDQGFIVHHITEESGTAKVQLRAATGSTSFPASGHDIEPNESGVVAWDQSDGRFEFHAFNAPSSSSGGLTESAAKALIENFAEVGAAGTIPLARFGDGIITEAKLATAVTTKLNEGEDNVQADWSETRTGNDAFIKNKPTIPAAFSDLTGEVADSQIPASIARDTEITTAINNLKGSGLAAGRDTLKELSDAIDAISSTGGLTETAVKNLIENFAEVGAAGTIPLARFGDGIITEAKLATAVTTKLNEGEDNVQADWSETRTGNDAFIKNKPTIPAAFSDLTGTVSDSQIPASIARDSEVTAAISGLSLGEDNVQADWDETSTTSDAFIKNKPTIPSAFSDLTGSVADSQIPASIARDTEITSAINALKGSGLAAGRDTLKELSDAIDAAASTGGISESDAKALIENFAEVGATGTIPLARFGDGVITAAKLASAVSALLLPTFPTAGDRNDKVPKFNGDTLGWEVDAIGTSSSGLDESAVKALIENFAEVGASGTVPLARFGDGIITEAKLATAVRTKLNEGEDNVQADWSETDTSDDSFIQNKPTIPSSFSDLSGSVADSQIPASIARDTEITTAINNLKGSGLAAGRDTLKELSDAIDAAASTGGLTETAVKNLIENFAEVGATGTIPLARFGDGIITEAKLASAVTTKLNEGEDNVQADWSETRTGNDAFIKNKPTIPSAFSDLSGSVADGQIPASIARDTEVTAAIDALKGSGLAAGRDTLKELSDAIDAVSAGDDNVQSDWNEADSTDDAFIKNKPTALLLPALPSIGDRNDKVPKFSGDTLGWELDAATSNRSDIQFNERGTTTWSRADLLSYDNLYILWQGSAAATWTFPNLRSGDGITFVVRNIESSRLTVSYTGLSSNLHIDRWDKVIFQWDGTTWSHEELNLSQVLTDAEIESNSLKITRLDGTTETSSLPAGGGGSKVAWIDSNQSYNAAQTLALDDHTIYCYPTSDITISLAALQSTQNAQLLIHNVGRGNGTDVTVSAAATNSANNVSNWRILQRSLTVFTWLTDRWYTFDMPFHSMITRARLNASNSKILELGTVTDADAWTLTLPIPDKATDAEARAGTDDSDYMTAAKVKEAIDHYLGQSAGANDVYWGGLAADPTSITQTPALQSADIPTNGIQTLTVARTWSGANRHMYIIQPAADDDISAFTLNGNPSTGWTGPTTFTEGGTQYEFWKSQYAWGSATAQGIRIGLTR